MTTNPEPSKSQLNKSSGKESPTPLSCLTGSLMAATMGMGLYALTSSIATSFANKPIQSDNSLVIGLSQAVRTLVIGVCALGTGVFCFAAVGLFLLAGQLIIQRFNKPKITN